METIFHCTSLCLWDFHWIVNGFSWTVVKEVYLYSDFVCFLYFLQQIKIYCFPLSSSIKSLTMYVSLIK